MKGALRLVRVFGIDIAVHWTFLLLIAWVVWLSVDQQRGASAGVVVLTALVAVTFVLSIFACVVLHELGHALTARAFGVQTKHITLLPIGGVAALERIPTQPLQELLITIAGPAVNVVIASALLAMVFLLGDIETPASPFTTIGGGFFFGLAIVNIALALFNMLPAFPMDGGRVLRALLATRLEYARATTIAAMCGRVMAFGFVAWWLFGGSPFLALIAVFVYFGGQAEMIAAAQRSAVTGMTVSAAMQTDFRVLPIEATLGEAAEAMLAGAQQDFPVVDADGRLVGLLRRGPLVDGVTSLGPSAPIREAIESELPALAESDDLARAMEHLRARGPALAVMRGGRLVGLLTQENLAEFLMVSGALHRNA